MARTPSLEHVLVTGATGFIGRALVARLVSEGVEVECLTRSSSARRAALESLAPSRVLALESFDAEGLAKAVGRRSFDAVFHLASYGVDPSDRDLRLMLQGNVDLTANLVHALAAEPPTRFVFTGSCSEYAPAAEGTYMSEDFPTRPDSVYGAAKLAASAVGSALGRKLGVPFVALRLFGTYGPGEPPHRLIPYVAHHLLAGTRPDLTAGEQERDLTHVDDVVEGLLLAASAPTVRPYDVYNLCSGTPHRIRDLAEAVADALGKPPTELDLGARPYRSDEAMWIVGDPQKFREAAGYKPKREFDQGVRDSVDKIKNTAAERHGV
jgi:nucleoside-diphosphate-sugar epimerase